jgi:hypothetical protein
MARSIQEGFVADADLQGDPMLDGAIEEAPLATVSMLSLISRFTLACGCCCARRTQKTFHTQCRGPRRRSSRAACGGQRDVQTAFESCLPRSFQWDQHPNFVGRHVLAYRMAFEAFVHFLLIVTLGATAYEALWHPGSDEKVDHHCGSVAASNSD